MPENLEKIDEISVGTGKADVKPYGLQYKNTTKSAFPLQKSSNPAFLSAYQTDFQILSKTDSLSSFPLISKLLLISELQNNLKHNLFLKILQESLENPAEPEKPSIKPNARIKERSIQSSPGNITPTRRSNKRSVSPLNKSRKSITPQRMTKLQSDPKELIQLAVDTSCLLSSTQTFPKETVPKLFYPLENMPTSKSILPNPGDFLSFDKKNLVKKLQNSKDEKDVLLSCIIAGTLGKQELTKAIENACMRLTGYAGVSLNLAVGNKAKAWELLEDNDEDVAYYSRISGKYEEFFAWVIRLYEDGFGFFCGLQLISAGFTALALQVLCKVGEERLAYWVVKALEGNCKNRFEIPNEFEAWFYELGPPRFRSRADEEIQALDLKYESKKTADFANFY